MIFDGAITDIQRQQVEGYLAQKWGLQSLLPVTHPYYTLNNLITYAFEPTQIPTCALWLDASDATSITGISLGQWNDKSGNGNNVTSAFTGTTLPTTNGTINGIRAMRFVAATNNSIVTPISLPTTNMSIFMVVTLTASSPSGARLAFTAPNSFQIIQNGALPNTVYYYSGATPSSNTLTVTALQPFVYDTNYR
jgi:hypothetical protein